MLVGMHVGSRAEIRRTAENVSEIDESVGRNPAATRRRSGNSAFVEVDRSGIQVGSLSVGNGSQIQVVSAASGSTTAQQIATTGDASLVELGPTATAGGSLPDSLIVAVSIYVPEIHFVAPGHDGKFSAVQQAPRSGGHRGTGHRTQPARLAVQPVPVDPVGGGINSVPLHRGKKLPAVALYTTEVAELGAMGRAASFGMA